MTCPKDLRASQVALVVKNPPAIGQNEDCRPGRSISDSSERVLQSGSGGRSIYVLVKGEYNFTKDFLLVMRI